MLLPSQKSTFGIFTPRDDCNDGEDIDVLRSPDLTDFPTHFLLCLSLDGFESNHLTRIFLGNRRLRDLAEDDETDLDRDSMHPRHEQTHNSKNHKEFGNITSDLKEVRLEI